VQDPAGDAPPPIRPVDPVPDVILVVHREGRDVPYQRLANEHGSGGVLRSIQNFAQCESNASRLRGIMQFDSGSSCSSYSRGKSLS
jgi:hypothetical protein